MKVSIEEVTPMVAEMLLQKNTNNYRKLSQPTVTKYANKMRQGKATFNNFNTINFDNQSEQSSIYDNHSIG